MIRYSGSRPLVPPPLAAYSTGQDDSSRSTSIKVPRSIFAGAIAEPRTELEFVDINEFSAALNLRDIAEAKQLPLLPLPPSLPKFGMAAMDKVQSLILTHSNALTLSRPTLGAGHCLTS